MKTYFTFLQRNKLFTFVNVIGLSISLMFLLLITHMVTRQLTVDKDMKDADRTYVLANDGQEVTSCWVTNCKAVIRK